MKPILLFDIDGTLLNVKRDFIRNCIEKIILELKATNLIQKPQSFAGKTDKDIFGHLSKNHPEPDFFYHQLKNQYIRYMHDYFDKSHLERIEGVEVILEYASKQGLKTGLCTGNFRETAYIKVDRAGLSERFDFGGFGCHQEDRAYLPGEAHLDYLQKIHNGNTEPDPDPNQYVGIGDTPNDIRCARFFGARVVAVSTGHFSEKELLYHKPDLLVKSLAELPAWLDQNF